MFSEAEIPAARTMYPLTSTARKLTDKGNFMHSCGNQYKTDHVLAEWGAIKGPMIAYMEEVRVVLTEHRKATLLRDSFTALYRQAYFQYILDRPPRVSILPPIHEVAMMQEFSPHLRANALNEDATKDALQDAAKIIPEHMENRANEVEDFFLGLVRQSSVYRGQNIDNEVLFYATTLFHCSKCGEVRAYPEVLAHECCYREFKIPEGRSSAVDEANESVFRRAFGKGASWEPGNRIRFSEEAYHHTLSVLGSLGMVATTNTQVLLGLNPYVELACKCYKTSRGSTHVRQAARWAEAVSTSALQPPDL